MGSGALMGVPFQGGQMAPGDQRAMGRRLFKGRAGFSPGGFSIQNDDQGEMLRYLADISRTGTGVPPGRGFGRVRRR